MTGCEECPSCYEPAEAITSHKFVCCTKTFHVRCAASWFSAPNQARSCPTCRNADLTARKFTESPDSIDASDMVWPCSRCGGGDEATEAVVCMGAKCYDKRTGLHKMDACALCFACAKVTAETVDAAPDYTCDRCVV